MADATSRANMKHRWLRTLGYIYIAYRHAYSHSQPSCTLISESIELGCENCLQLELHASAEFRSRVRIENLVLLSMLKPRLFFSPI